MVHFKKKRSAYPYISDRAEGGNNAAAHCLIDNSMMLQGYDRSQSFIVTQDPLDTTVVDFWRMIIEQNISTIVMLSELGCSPSQTKCHPYWPVNSELICDYVKVKFVREEANDFYIRRDFDIVNAKVNKNMALSTLLNSN